MGEEKRKPDTDKTPKPLDRITDGFFDLSEVYSGAPKKPKTKPLSREEELKQRDEKRRELEMAAIKEDIERRYSIQLEEAQNNVQEKEKTETQPPFQAHGVFHLSASILLLC